MMSFDNAPDKSNCKVLFCIITAISAIIKIISTVVIYDK